MATPPRLDLAKILGKRGFVSEVDRLRAQEADSRAVAKNLLGTDILRDKDIDAAKLLVTTLGGQIRPITLDDLRTFSATAQKLGKRFKGGITARGVVDSSNQIDRDRANIQIRTAIVVRAHAGLLHFVTNAGPDSDDLRHHVYVDFPAFKAFSTSPLPPKKLARAMLDGPLRFECDCKRFRYFFRYLATKGGFVLGRSEQSFPKITNPRLTGISCKHGLRVMQAVLRDGAVTVKVAAMIAAGQAGNTKAQVTTAAEAKAQAQAQLAQSHHRKNIAETTADAKKRIAGTTAGKVRALQSATKEARRRMETQAKKSREALQADFTKILNNAALTPAMRAQLTAMRDASLAEAK